MLSYLMINFGQAIILHTYSFQRALLNLKQVQIMDMRITTHSCIAPTELTGEKALVVQ